MDHQDLSGPARGGHTGQRQGLQSVVLYLIALIMIAGALSVSGCGGDGNNQASNTTAAGLSNTAYTYSSGEVFGIDSSAGEMTLVFGTFTGNSAPFRLEAGSVGASATGTATLGSCILQVNIGNFRANQGPQPGTRIVLDLCTLLSDGRLLVANTALGKTATSFNQGAAARPPAGIGRLTTPSRSTSIALAADDRLAVVANRTTNTVAILEVRNLQGQDVATKLAELGVGQEPRYVAISPDDREIYVSNAVSGTVSVIPLLGRDTGRVVADIAVGPEPRGIAVTPNGTQLYVANHTAGTVSVIDVASRTVTATVPVGGNPTAIAITNNGDSNDTDETVFVTQFYARLRAGGPGEGFDTGKEGVVRAFAVANPGTVSTITLAPLANAGFTADRSQFCPQSRAAGAPPLQSTIYCPDVNAAPTSPTITAAPQGAFPNQLQAALIRNSRLFLPSIGAAPEPPIQFRVNVQGLVQVVDTTTRTEVQNLRVNLNQQVAQETQPANPTQSLGRLFSNDLVAIDANTAGTDFLIVSRGGNFVFRAGLDANGALSLGTPNVVRFQTGNIPNGVVISRDGRRAYVNNEVNVSVTAIALDSGTVLTRDLAAGEAPRPGTFEHSVLVGKLAFFTALGMPDNGIFDTPIRDFVPLNDRGKASDNAWSGCGSCHPDGLADGVTWSFGTGPRQTVPLDAFFAKDNPDDQRISNWSAVMGSITDFNGNSRGVQGGIGFAGNPPNPRIYPHGITQGASDALDAQTLWVQTVRAPLMPIPTDTAALSRGRTVFQNRCATCHGGQKWSKSQVIYADNPAFDADPTGAQPGVARDPGLSFAAGGQIVSYTVNAKTLKFLDDVGTFTATSPLEIRGAGGQIGARAAGALGFNVPALLGVRYHAPYFHNGAAQTLDDVFNLHVLVPAVGATPAVTITGALSATDRQDLTVFLNSIDNRTDSLRSATDDFRDNITPVTTAQVRHANLTGAQEVPPVTTTATGTLTLTINATRTQIDYRLDTVGPFTSNVVVAHIHTGAPIGTNASANLFFCVNGIPPAGVPVPQACPTTGGTITGTLTAADFVLNSGAAAGVNNFADAVAEILSGNAYANVHTVMFGGGEIRGQIERP